LFDRKANPEPELKDLNQQLDNAYQQTNDALIDDPNLRMEMIDGIPRPIVTPLDPDETTPERERLKQALTKRLPDVDLPDLMLEVHQMTTFADAFTHVSERNARIDDLAVSICAVLLAEACNIGLEAVIDENISALSSKRLVWVQQNYIRPDTIREANRWLIQAQARLHIAQLWGGGDIASADGLRFVVPQKAIHGGYNRKYFGSGRGVTFFNFMSDQFTGFHHLVIPGTLKEALFILDGLLDQKSPIQPTEIMTDTNSYTDIVFGLFWLLGFQFSPRLADIKDRRFWRMERQADYGIFNEISKHKINTKRILTDWDDMLRVAGSLKTGDVRPSHLLRIFSASSGSTSLAKSIRDVGRIAKTLYMLHYLRDESYRRRILTQLNHTELRHKLARHICYGNRGELRQSYKEGQEEQLGALGLLLNIVVYWNTYYLDLALADLLQHDDDVPYDELAHITPLAYAHIRVLGRYHFTLHSLVQQGQPRLLKPLGLD
jgi:TnpA family transposase